MSTFIMQFPPSWTFTKMKRLFVERKGRTVSGAETLLSVSAYTGVSPRETLTANDEFLTRAESLENYKIVRAGDLVVNTMLAWNGALAFSEYDGITSPAYAVYQAVADIHAKFYDYLLRSPEYREYYKSRSTGIVESRLRLYPDVFGLLIIPKPPLATQIAIANFLDRETKKIDDLISNLEKLIELLKEKRQAVISHAVTKGLNPDAKMKDSGVEWIGEVPEHWEVVPLKRLVSCNDEVLPESTGDDLEFNYIEIGDVATYGYQIGHTATTFKNAPSRARRVVQPNDVIISTVRTYLKAIAMMPTCTTKTIVSTGFAVLRPIHVESTFLYNICVSEGFIDEIIANSNGVSYPAINAADLLNFKVPSPPLCEQATLSELLRKKGSETESAINSASSLIQLMREKRAALISAAVTGQIDIAEAA